MLLIKRLAFNWACMTLIFMQNKCFSINLSALCVFAHSLLQRWMQACLCAYIIGGVCDMCAHITLGSQVLLSWVWSFSLSVVVWEQSGHTSPHPPPHPRRVSAPAGAPEIRLSYEKRPPRSCEVDQGSAGANTAKCPGMAQIRQVGSEARWEVGNVCASVFGGQGVGSLVAFHTNVGHLWQTRWT